MCSTFNCFAGRIAYVFSVVLYSWCTSSSASAENVGIGDWSCGWCKRDKGKKKDRWNRQTYRKSLKLKRTDDLWTLTSPTNGKTSYCVSELIVPSSAENAEMHKKRVTTKLKWREHSTTHSYYTYSRGILQDVFVPVWLYNTIPLRLPFDSRIFSSSGLKTFRKHHARALVTNQTGPAAFYLVGWHLCYYFLWTLTTIRERLLIQNKYSEWNIGNW